MNPLRIFLLAALILVVFGSNEGAAVPDPYVSNVDVDVGDGKAGKEHNITFEIGTLGEDDDTPIRVFFNLSIAGTFGWGELVDLTMRNSTEYYPIGTGYEAGLTYGAAYIDFNGSYNSQMVVFPWIPNKDRTDNYNISVSISINNSNGDNQSNNNAYQNDIHMERFTTNLVIDAIKITQMEDILTIKVTVGYPQGEQSELDVEVGLLVYRLLDYYEDKPPIDSLTVKSIQGILKGDSRPISYTWNASLFGETGDYFFVAIVDPDNIIDESNESDNTYLSSAFYFEPEVYGCMDSSATNYNETANRDDGSCTYDTDGDGVLDRDEVEGCTDKNAANYSSIATDDDDSCKYAPIAIAGKDITVIEGEVVQFSGAGTDSDGTVVKYEWDFDGDGVFEWSSEENGISTFFYNDGGVYLTALRVTDNDGNTAVDNRAVTVIADITEGQQGRDEGESLLPSISLITSLISIGLIAIFRRK